VWQVLEELAGRGYRVPEPVAYEVVRSFAEKLRLSRNQKRTPTPGREFFLKFLRQALGPEAAAVRSAVFGQYEPPFRQAEDVEGWLRKASPEQVRQLVEGAERLAQLCGWPVDSMLRFLTTGQLEAEPVVLPASLPRVVDGQEVEPGPVTYVWLGVPAWLVTGRSELATRLWRAARKAVVGSVIRARRVTPPITPKQEAVLAAVEKLGPPPGRPGRLPYWARVAEEVKEALGKRVTPGAVRMAWLRMQKASRPRRRR
jgi:hypothetical protein